MTYIYILHDKNGNFYSLAPSLLLNHQIQDTYQYCEQDVLDEAQEVFATLSEDLAWTFLVSRSHWEYERVSREEVLEW